jgi:hypothetical protein
MLMLFLIKNFIAKINDVLSRFVWVCSALSRKIITSEQFCLVWYNAVVRSKSTDVSEEHFASIFSTEE